MSFYREYILPGIVNHLCSSSPITRQREKIVRQATGRVLEIGVGSGLNFPFYDHRKVSLLIGLEPSLKMISMAEKRAQRRMDRVSFLDASACQIPLESNSIDSVVVTYTLCTIPDILSALKEMYRVPKPGGKLYFCEHGLAPDKAVLKWQNRLTSLWRYIAGGCHLNRRIPELIEGEGFYIQEMKTTYLPGPRPLTFNYWGRGIKR